MTFLEVTLRIGAKAQEGLRRLEGLISHMEKSGVKCLKSEVRQGRNQKLE